MLILKEWDKNIRTQFYFDIIPALEKLNREKQLNENYCH